MKFSERQSLGKFKIQNRNCVARLHSKIEHRTQENIFNEASLCDLLQKWQCKHRINSLFCNILPKSSISKLKMPVRNLSACFFFQTRTLDDSFEVTVTTLASKLTYIAPTQKRPPVVTCCFSCGVCLVVHPAVSGVGVGTLGRESQKK